ncbi:MAG: mismatch endonuclease Vsr [Edaphobacter sp.]|nr:mismatch endonuclease Vsr [Edaphobacter sp.]
MRRAKDVSGTMVCEGAPLRAMRDRGTSWATSPAVRRVMQGNRSRDTGPEIAVRCAVHALGMRYRVAERPVTTLRRTADMVFSRVRVAIFVDGCFWHGCPAHHLPPKSNAEYWAVKIATNKARDAHTTASLEAAGWTVMRFWSHEEPDGVAARIAAEVRCRLAAGMTQRARSRRSVSADGRRSGCR